MGKYTKDQRRKYQQKYRQKIRKESICLLGGICVNCGTKDMLEFDRIDSKTKINTISSIIALGNKKTLKSELKKCQLLCNKCHLQKSIDNKDIPPRKIRYRFESYPAHFRRNLNVPCRRNTLGYILANC